MTNQSSNFVPSVELKNQVVELFDPKRIRAAVLDDLITLAPFFVTSQQELRGYKKERRQLKKEGY